MPQLGQVSHDGQHGDEDIFSTVSERDTVL